MSERRCAEVIYIRTEDGKLISTRCEEPALEGKDRCIFHDPDAWREHADLIRKKIKEKIERGDLNFQKYHLPRINFSEITEEFRGVVDFSGAVFHEGASFNRITFLGDAIFANAHFLGDASFRGAVFCAHAVFNECVFEKECTFEDARISGDAHFEKAVFKREAWLGNTSISGDAFFNETRFLGRTSFEGAEIVGDAVFIGAEFREGKVSFNGAEFSADLDFSHAKFHVEKVAFDNVSFSGDVVLQEAEFHCDAASFDDVSFSGNVKMEGARFLANCVSFDGAEFAGDVVIRDVDFEGTIISFEAAVFSGDAFFEGIKCLSEEGTFFNNAEFYGDALFRKAKFRGPTYFDDAEFHGKTSFEKCLFASGVAFDHAVFSGRTYFRAVDFREEARFVGCDFAYVAFENSKFHTMAVFDFACFREVMVLSGIDLSQAPASFIGTSFEGRIYLDEESWKQRSFRLHLEEVDLSKAAESYLSLRRGFSNMGKYRIAGELFYREMTCRKNMMTLRDVRRQGLRYLVDWIWMRAFDLLCGFGERPRRVIAWSVFVILAFTGIYYFLISGATVADRLLMAFLLSLGAFTLGGLLQIEVPITAAWLWILWPLESALGWAMLSLFMLTFTRKMSRD